MKQQKIQIKLAQLNLAMRHVLRNRMQKQANDEEEIRKLKEQRDKGWLSDILGGIGWGSLYGTGIGGIGGGVLGTIGGKAVGNGVENARQQLQNSGALDDNDQANMQAMSNVAKEWGPTGFGILGGLSGISMGLPIGGTIGGLYRLATHNSRKQKAIDKLKELGVESNE